MASYLSLALARLHVYNGAAGVQNGSHEAIIEPVIDFLDLNRLVAQAPSSFKNISLSDYQTIMQLTTLALLTSLSAVCFAAPANNHVDIVPRQTKKPEPTPTKTTIKTTTKTTEKPTKTTTEETGPSSTRCPVPAYYKCGGWDYTKPWDGCTVCEKGSTCVEQNEWYFQCVPNDAIVAE
ncbi:hypothetical protein J4E90_009772 [Alternaria incomplexa]|uniref:uncharacterized protein n=1 Tax=Alternaria incomplexa TaxID=1187928 RepID=UPI002220BFBF|nr:uncharacterized protein J4E90_009772 [Alternaria incomplexa]KAI4907269.1 hypothetical protein J4E90_009772 [Alternaria incomplexa]